MRLAKLLATAGVASRRAAEDLVRAGRVTVDDEVVTDPGVEEIAGHECGLARSVGSSDGRSSLQPGKSKALSACPVCAGEVGLKKG